MIICRKMKKRTLYLWALVLSISLVCTQGVKRHVHSLDEHNQQHSHITAEAPVEHSHLSKVHLSIDDSHRDHHDKVIAEFDASLYGVLKKVSNSVLTLALFTTLFIFFLSDFYPQTFHRLREKSTILLWRYRCSPPLRAPPL
jgi:hypothetical protein